MTIRNWETERHICACISARTSSEMLHCRENVRTLADQSTVQPAPISPATPALVPKDTMRWGEQWGCNCSVSLQPPLDCGLCTSRALSGFFVLKPPWLCFTSYNPHKHPACTPASSTLFYSAAADCLKNQSPCAYFKKPPRQPPL